jgi:hypothetical protein
MDMETFDVMWELSAPGSAAEECFMRIPQTEYYVGECRRPHPLDNMPDVSGQSVQYHASQSSFS